MGLLFRHNINRRDYAETKVKLDYTKTWVQSSFVGNVQPVKGRDLQVGAEGNWSVGSVKVYSEVKLDVKKSGQTGTFIEFDDEWYEVAASMPYKAGGAFAVIDHYKYIAEPRTNAEVGL